MEQAKVLNVAIVGGGPGCKAIMEMIFAEKLSQLRMSLVGVACTNPKAVGFRYAQEKGVYTTRDYRDLYKIKDLNLIIELTGRKKVANEISRTKPDHVQLMDHVSARLFWDVFRIEEKRIAERKGAEEELRKSREQLRDLAGHLQSIREEERRLIAREIHDELGQAMTALKMDLHWLAKRLPTDQQSMFDKIESMSKLIDKTVKCVQRICAELRPSLLDDLGLSAAIEWQAEEWQQRTGIKCDVTSNPKEMIFNQDLSTAIFRIFQETLTNVARHANASRVVVSFEQKAGQLEVKMTDNGKGITQKEISDPKSFGLIGMRERAHYWGGSVIIRGIRNKGTTVTLSVPLDRRGGTG